MSSLSPSQGTLRFGDFDVDLRSGELRKHGMRIKLQVQPFQVLQVLLEHPGEVVTREDLQKRIWPADTFVDFEQGLNNAVKKLRDALGDHPDNPQFIETLSRRGYRFIAVVHKNGTNGSSAISGQTAPKVALTSTLGRRTVASLVETVSEYRRAKRLWMGIAALLAIGGFVLVLVQFHVLPVGAERVAQPASSATPFIHSLAVLPLQNLSADPGQEYLSDGMTDALITDLAQIGSLRVISRTSTIRYKKTDKSLPQIARELGVDGIVEGTVQRSGDRVLITAQLIDGATDKHLWAQSYERDIRDLFLLERAVTEDIARQIQARLSTKNPAEHTQLRPMDPKALQAYLQGNYHLNLQGKGFGDSEKRKAAEYFQQAIAADPNFAPTYNGLALAHENLLLGSSEDVAIATAAAKKATEVDPNYPVAHATLGALKWQPDLDWRGAEEEFRHAVSLNPNVAWGHSGLGILLIVLGRADEGLRECRIAQRLDPFDDDSALCLYYGRDYDGSIAMFRMLLQADPNVGLWHCDLFPDFMMKGMQKESIQELEQCFSLYGQPAVAANIHRAFAHSGYREAVRQWATEVERLQATHQVFLPGFLAQAYALLGEKDRAFYWLEQAYAHREIDSFDSGVFYMSAEPMYDPLRSDPRFKDLLRRVGLPQ